MHFAATHGDLACMKWLHDVGASVDKSSEEGTPMSCAARRGHLECVKWLKQRGAKFGAAQLFSAASNGQLECMKWLKEQGVDTNVETSQGTTPLHFAASRGHLECMAWLVQHGARVHAFDHELFSKYGDTPLFYAVRGGSVASMQWLKDQDSAVVAEQRVLDDCLRWAIKYSHLSCAQWLVDHGADVHVADEYGTLLMCVNRSETALWLLERGVELDVQNSHDETALMKVFDMSHVDVIAVLLAWGAEHDIVDEDGKTAVQRRVAIPTSPAAIKARAALRQGVNTLRQTHEAAARLLCDCMPADTARVVLQFTFPVYAYTASEYSSGHWWR